MTRSLGSFTSYGIEYVYDYLGESKIFERLDELKDVPTMGRTFESFLKCDPIYGFTSGHGILHAFNLLSDWFYELEFLQFLYISSKEYDDTNYLESGLQPQHEQTIRINGSSPYWIDYHLFYSTLLRRFKEAIKVERISKIKFEGLYKLFKNKLIGEIELEIKKRRKPLEGKYLLFRKESVWYNLIELGEDTEEYKFEKDGEKYLLKTNRINSSAAIKLIQSSSLSINGNINNVESLFIEIAESYIANIEGVARGSMIYNRAYNLLNYKHNNSCLWDIASYYEEKGEYSNANMIAKINNKHKSIWTEMPLFDTNN